MAAGGGGTQYRSEGGCSQTADALVEVQDAAGGADGVEYAVVDDGVDSEGDRVGGEDLLGRDLEHLQSPDKVKSAVSDEHLGWDVRCGPSPGSGCPLA